MSANFLPENLEIKWLKMKTVRNTAGRQATKRLGKFINGFCSLKIFFTEAQNPIKAYFSLNQYCNLRICSFKSTGKTVLGQNGICMAIKYYF